MIVKVVYVVAMSVIFIFSIYFSPPQNPPPPRRQEKWERDMTLARLTPTSLRAQKLLRIVSKCSALCLGSD